ncbi:hypothetical protein JGS22_013420 [Streptomyces sp. P38-E01]|uniref:Integral membrane protein n=1 Tax=Streptomyces tardus TaxID=2780544 RepID=A0A949JQX2_9ACTN|nr:hypothetical protein [Streptomyces tardus]MBU7598585.1 hypothetical protein [Streptomyces tardus]
MDHQEPELRKELDATLQTRKDLGSEYESELVDSFIEKLDHKVDSVVDKRVRRQLAEQQMAIARGSTQTEGPVISGLGATFGLAVLSLILAIPLSAIAVVNAGLPGLATAWMGIVGVNAVYSIGRVSWTRRQKEHGETDW